MPPHLADADGLGEMRRQVKLRTGRRELLGAARRWRSWATATPANNRATRRRGSFAAASPRRSAAARVVELLREEAADALIIYDEHGITGHPDHVQVHVVGMRAAARLPELRVYQGTLSESQLAVFVANVATFITAAGPPAAAGGGPMLYASPDASVTTRVDVRPWSARKRAAMAAHASQIGPESFLLARYRGLHGGVRDRELPRPLGARRRGGGEAATLGAGGCLGDSSGDLLTRWPGTGLRRQGARRRRAAAGRLGGVPG